MSASSLPPRQKSAASFLPLLEELRNDPSTRAHAFESVSEMSGQPISALYRAREYHRASETATYRLKFSPETEDIFTAFLVARSSLKIPASTAQFMDFVVRLTGQTVTKSWVSRFYKRHQKVIKRGKPRVEPRKRHVSKLVLNTKAFIDCFSQWSEHNNVTASTLLNTDEKRGSFKSTTGIRFMARGEFNANIEQPRVQSLFTILPFVKASGELVAIFYFFAEPSQESKETKVVWIPSDGDEHRFVALTATSYLCGEHYRDACLKVADILQEEAPGARFTLLQDNAPIHVNEETVEQCLEKNLCLHGLITDGTAFCQPLDVGCFGVWQSAFDSLSAQIIWSTVESKEVLPTLLAIAFKAEATAFSPRVVRSAFRRAYIYPWSPRKLLQRAQAETAKLLPAPTSHLIDAAAKVMIEQVRDAGVLQKDLVNSVISADLERGKMVDTLSLARESKQKRTDKQMKEAEKVEKKRQRDGRVQLRRDEAAARAEYREQHRCAAKGCKHVRHRSKKWTVCDRCNKDICPKHSQQGGVHPCTAAKKTNKKKRQRK